MKTNFKKMLAGILSAAMMMSTTSFLTVNAASYDFKYDYENQSTGLGIVDTNVTGTVEWKDGVNGKDNTYALAKSGSENDGEFRMQIANGAWTKQDGMNYLVMTAQIMPKDDNINKLYWGTNSQWSIASASADSQDLAAKALVKNQWNTYTAVYKWDGTQVKSYVNGTEVYSGTPSATLYETTGTQKRIQFHVFTNNVVGTEFGLDKMHIYQTAEIPSVAMPTLASGEGYTVSGKNIIVSDSVTASTFANANVYKDSTFAALVDNDATVKAGNVVVVGGENGYTYYSVTDGTTSCFDIQDETSSPNISDVDGVELNWVNGVGGKDVADKVADITYTSNGFVNVGYTWSQKDTSAKYVVLEMNVMPKSNINNASIGVDYQGWQISGYVTNLKANQWNKIVTVVSLDEYETSDKKARKAVTYLNGEKAMETWTKLGLGAANVPDAAARFNKVRIITQRTNEDESAKFCLDDIKMYESVYAPTVGVSKLASADDYIVSGGKFGISKGKTITPADIVSNDNVAVYTDNTYATKVDNNTALANGNVVVVSGANGYTYYDVETNYSGITECMTIDKTPADTTPNFSIPEGNTLEWAKGIGGKLAEDESAKIGLIEYNFVNIDDKFCWTQKNKDSKYLVFEANVLSEDNIKMNFAVENGGANLGYVSAASAFKAGEWNKVVTVVYLDQYNEERNARYADTYLNGAKSVAQWTKFGLGDNARDKKLRLCFTGTGTVYLDDIKVYESVFAPEITFASELSSDVINGSFVFDKSTQSIRGSKTATVADATTAFGGEVVRGANTLAEGTITQGDKLAVVNETNDFAYYTFGAPYEDYEMILFGDAYDKTSNKVMNGEFNAAVSVTEGDAVITSVYDKDGVLKNVSVQNAEKTGLQNFTITSPVNKGGKMKLMIWDGMDKIDPKATATELPYGETDVTIACWGASLTHGQGATNAETESYPAVLASKTGKTVYKMGVGGETLYTIAARQGAFDIVLKNDFTIPANKTAVDISFEGADGGVVAPRNTNIGGWNPVTIAGVEGWISVETEKDSSGMSHVKSAKFTRNETGEAVDVKAGEKLITSASKLQADVNVFLVGMNGGWDKDNQGLSTSNDPTKYIASVDKMLEKIPGGKDNGKYVVVGITNDGDWANLYTALQNAYGDHFLDIKRYLASEQALSDAGIEATEDDTARIDEGNVCASLLNNYATDKVHLNTKGYKLLGTKVYEKLQALEYVK